MAATLVANNGTRAVDPRTVLSHWRRAVAAPTDDLPADSARRFARALGAGHVLTGSIIGTSVSLTVNLELTDVARGSVHNMRVTGNADSLTQLVDRVTGTVLAYAANEVDERASLLAGVPLVAVRAYLEGQKKQRSGRHDEAVLHFTDALRADSMFVLAAIGLHTANSWNQSADQATLGRARDLAWHNKERLPAVDRAILIASLGPHYPKASSAVEYIAAAREAVRIAPDRPEPYMRLGDWLFHRGMAIGIENAHDEAEHMFLRVLASDSALSGAIEHLAQMAFAKGDTAAVMHWVDTGLRVDSIGVTAEQLRLLRAAARNDQEEFRRLQAGTGDDSNSWRGPIIHHAQKGALGLREADLAARGWQYDPPHTWFYPYSYHLNRGRPAEAARALAVGRRIPAHRTLVDAAIVWSALLGRGNTAELDPAITGLQETGHNTELLAIERTVALCAFEAWKAANGRHETVAASIATLRSLAQDTVFPSAAAELCAALLEAQVATRTGAPQAARLIARADSISAQGPAGTEVFFLHPTNLLIAELYQLRGDDRAALRVLKRRFFYYGPDEFYTTSLLERARVASRLGERDEAVQSYRHYLALMDDAEAVLHAEREAARTELQQLLADQR